MSKKVLTYQIQLNGAVGQEGGEKIMNFNSTIDTIKLRDCY